VDGRAKPGHDVLRGRLGLPHEATERRLAGPFPLFQRDFSGFGLAFFLLSACDGLCFSLLQGLDLTRINSKISAR